MAIQPTTFPSIVDVPTPSEISIWREAEQIKDFPDEFGEVDERDLKKTAKVTIKVGQSSRITIWAKAGLAAGAAFLLDVAVQFATETLTQTTTQRRRRKKTEICARRCLDIIKDARKDIDYMGNRSLESDRSPPRYRRKTGSRKSKNSKSS